MSFFTTMEHEGVEFEVLNFSMEFSRETHANGQPTSEIHGGLVEIEVQSTEENVLFANMIDGFKTGDFKITIKQSDEDAEMRSIEIKDAFIYKIRENLDYTGDNTMSTTIQVSAKEIINGDADYQSMWVSSDWG